MSKIRNKRKLPKPKLDVVFHALFKEGNEEITKALISAVTKDKINKIDLSKDRHLLGAYVEEKLRNNRFKSSVR